jgi:hypothetical protein
MASAVRKEDLRLDMFVQSLGSRFDHPFWRSKFLLTEPGDLRALQASDIESVWIDEKSLAPPSPTTRHPRPGRGHQEHRHLSGRQGLVRLESHRLGCVAAQRRDQLTRPLVPARLGQVRIDHPPGPARAPRGLTPAGSFEADPGRAVDCWILVGFDPSHSSDSGSGLGFGSFTVRRAPPLKSCQLCQLPAWRRQL